MPVYRVFLDVVDPNGKLAKPQITTFVQDLLTSAKVEITPPMKKEGIKVIVRNQGNSANDYGSKMQDGFHLHDGTDGCYPCRSGYDDQVNDSTYTD